MGVHGKTYVLSRWGTIPLDEYEAMMNRLEDDRVTQLVESMDSFQRTLDFIRSLPEVEL